VFAATKLGSKDNEGEKGETIKIIHTAGETEVPKNPEKVVVLDYASLDIMDSLDIKGLVGLPKKICQLIFQNIRKKNMQI